MISLPGTPWGCTGSLDKPVYVEVKSPASSQGAAPLRHLFDLSRPFESIDGISIRRLNAGWITSIWQRGVVLVVPRDSLEN